MLDDTIPLHNFLWQEKKDLLSQFNNKERQYLKNKKTIKMCIDPHWMPFEMIYRNKHIGLSADYMQILSQKIGKEVPSKKLWVIQNQL
jgi:hypothetical protein